MNVFFYGLFMDLALLAEKGIEPRSMAVGFVDAYELQIGERATLVPTANARAYGVTMDISSDDIRTLYSENSVADYVAESVVVELVDGRVDALAYILPAGEIPGANKAYAGALLDVAEKLGLPGDYLDQIRKMAQ